MTFRLSRTLIILVVTCLSPMIASVSASAAESPMSSTAATIESLTTTVLDVLKPERPNESWIFLLAADGRALRVPDSDRSRVEVLLNAVGKPKFLHLEIENQGRVDAIHSLTELPQPASYGPGGVLDIEPLSSRDATLVKRLDFDFNGYELTPQGLFDFFKSMRLRTPSQCFHRAYRWAHQAWLNTGAVSYKVFMFFSWKYIRTFNYHWWFHVAPYVFDENGQEIVLDPTYLKRPVTMRQWTDNFLRNDPECPTVTKYLGHSAHGQGEWCYLVKTPMQYYHPNTVEAVNKGATPVKTWDAGYLGLSVRGTSR